MKTKKAKKIKLTDIERLNLSPLGKLLCWAKGQGYKDANEALAQMGWRDMKQYTFEEIVGSGGSYYKIIQGFTSTEFGIVRITCENSLSKAVMKE